MKYNNIFSNYCVLPFLLNTFTAGDVQIYNKSKYNIIQFTHKYWQRQTKKEMFSF